MHIALLSLVLAAGSPSPEQIGIPFFPNIWSLLRYEKTPPAPFQLKPEEQAQLVKVLDTWEKANIKIKTFDCKFKCWDYRPGIARSKEEENKPTHIDLGLIKYAAPDKGKYQVTTTVQVQSDGTEKVVPIETNRAELYIWDGKSVYLDDPMKRIRHEHQLPQELRGQPPGSFLFPHFYFLAFEAKKLQSQIYLRLVTPRNVKEQIWIEVYPRFGNDASYINHLIIILEERSMLPFALKVVLPGGKNWYSYKYYDVTVNDPSLNGPDAFQADTPRGWIKEVHEIQSTETRHVSGGRH
jgi:hypothetical protein